MRVAALYDIHGNVPALDAVLAELDGDEHVVVGGDFVAGPWPGETLDRLLALGDRVRWIRGNADREVVEPSEPRPGGPPPEVMEFVRGRLRRDQLEFLRELPLTETIELDAVGRVLFCHATPRSDDELLTRISPDERWRTALAGADADVVVCGHTHIQFDRTIGDIRLVNAGSVGMPYEAQPGAYWLRLGPGVELVRTAYDTDAAAAAVVESGWPEEWPAATPDEATEFFERISRERG